MKREIIILPLIFFFGSCGTTAKKRELKTIPLPKQKVVKMTPGSLWPGENSKNSLFADFRAKEVGDIITVMIVEKTKAKKEAITSTSRSSNTDASIDNVLGLPLNFKLKNSLIKPSVKGGQINNFKGSGLTERKGEITTTVATRVMEVLPNGNLLIEGKKETTVNKEKQYVVLSGIVRTEDIYSANKVYSDVVADLKIELSGYGVLSEKQNPGWFARILDKVWPF